MKRLILILLCFPLFILSQEEKTYTSTMSVSQFAKELKLRNKQCDAIANFYDSINKFHDLLEKLDCKELFRVILEEFNIEPEIFIELNESVQSEVLQHLSIESLTKIIRMPNKGFRD